MLIIVNFTKMIVTWMMLSKNSLVSDLLPISHGIKLSFNRTWKPSLSIAFWPLSGRHSASPKVFPLRQHPVWANGDTILVQRLIFHCNYLTLLICLVTLDHLVLSMIQTLMEFKFFLIKANSWAAQFEMHSGSDRNWTSLFAFTSEDSLKSTRGQQQSEVDC